jgi:hypothetical protein
MACDPATTITSAELAGLNSDTQTIDTVVESSEATTTTKNGKVIPTLSGKIATIGGFVTEAPQDGNIYIRVNGGWVQWVAP